MSGALKLGRLDARVDLRGVDPRVAKQRANLLERDLARELLDQILRVVEVEGPIHLEILL